VVADCVAGIGDRAKQGWVLFSASAYNEKCGVPVVGGEEVENAGSDFGVWAVVEC
jgi:hypothetical protein